MKIAQKNLKGQAMLVLVLLTMISALAIGTSVVVRSIVSGKGTSFFSQNELAFNAADSGVELALKDVKSKLQANPPQDPTTSAPITGAAGLSKYKYTVDQLGNGTVNTSLTMPNITLNENQIEAYVLSESSSGKVQSVDIVAGNKANFKFAVEVNLLKEIGGGNYQLTQQTYKCPPTASFAGATNLITSGVIDNGDKTCSINLSNVSQYQLLQVVPRFENLTTLKVTLNPVSGQKIPLQGYIVRSDGTAGNSQRSITVMYQVPNLARIFNNTLYTREVVASP